MRRITFGTPAARPPASRVWMLLLAILPWLAAVDAECQTVKPSSPPPGSATPWSIPERFDPDSYVPKEDADEAEKLRKLECHIREIEELDRLYVEDAADRTHYWVQLPSTVKIRPANRASFGGRKKLKLEDLEVGQRLELTLRRSDDEILKVRVWPPAKEPAG